nr:cytochrome p450 [Quercus suber]
MIKEAMSRPMNLSHDIFPTILPHVHSWVDKYGNNYLQWFGPKAQLVVTEPELIKEIMNNRDNAYSKPEAGNYAKKLLGDGLVTSESNNYLQWFGPKAQLVVTEPELIKEIMNNRDNAYSKPEAGNYAKKLLGDGLVTSESEKWANMWKLANYAFHAESLKVKRLTYLKNLGYSLLTSEVISRTAFGSSYLEGKNIFEMLMKLALISSRNTYKLRFPGISKIYKTNDEIESEELVKGIYNAILEIIKKREEKVMTGEGIGGDFLQLLVEGHHDPNASQKISIEDLLDECKTFYIAGQETTSTLLGWTIFLLAIHTDWQEEARKEVLNLFGQQIPNPDGITKLKTARMS